MQRSAFELGRVTPLSESLHCWIGHEIVLRMILVTKEVAVICCYYLIYSTRSIELTR